MKADIYQSLYMINESLQAVTEHLDKLKAAGILPSEFSEIRRTAAEQMRAEINVKATEVLHTKESQESAQFEQQRIRQESRLREVSLEKPTLP